MTTLGNVSIACWTGMHQECARLQATPGSVYAEGKPCPCKCHAFQRKDKAKVKR